MRFAPATQTRRTPIRRAALPMGPMEYRIDGAGPAVLLLNGGHCSRTTRLSHERLAQVGYTVITPSRPGYDATPPSVGRTAQAAADALAALLDRLQIATVAVIAISAAGPTALAFAQQYPERTTKLILESAVTLPWDPAITGHARRLFGRMQRLTWALVRLGLRLLPTTTTKAMLRAFTTLDVTEVWARLTPSDRHFVHTMLRSMQSGRGFVCDLEHRVDRLDRIVAPVLVLYSPHDPSVPPTHAQRIGREIPHSEVHAIAADTHLLWIGPAAEHVWHLRQHFLEQEAPGEGSPQSRVSSPDEQY